LRFVIIASPGDAAVTVAAWVRDGYADVVKRYKTLAAKGKSLEDQWLATRFRSW
jgi:hypothetical protein